MQSAAFEVQRKSRNLHDAARVGIAKCGVARSGASISVQMPLYIKRKSCRLAKSDTRTGELRGGALASVLNAALANGTKISRSFASVLGWV